MKGCTMMMGDSLIETLEGDVAAAASGMVLPRPGFTGAVGGASRTRNRR